jgi:hypothetical protein
MLTLPQAAVSAESIPTATGAFVKKSYAGPSTRGLSKESYRLAVYVFLGLGVFSQL